MPNPTWSPDGAWTLVFSDEFDSTVLDLTKWRNGIDGTGDLQPGLEYCLNTFDIRNVSVFNGNLELRLINGPQSAGGRSFRYSGSAISTRGKFDVTPEAAIEFRVYLPGVSGRIANWPAVWTVGTNWPVNGEIDILEGMEGKASCYFHSGTGDGMPGNGFAVPGDYTGWHTAGVHWRAGRVDYYFDGKLVGTITKGITTAPQFICIDQMTADWDSDRLIPSTLLVDWVRVWKPGSIEPPPPPPATLPAPTGLRVTSQTASSVSVAWDTVTGAASYEGHVYSAAGMVWSGYPAETAVTIPLAEGSYKLYVRARNGEVRSLASAPLLFTIAPAAPTYYRHEVVSGNVKTLWDVAAAYGTTVDVLETISRTKLSAANMVVLDAYLDLDAALNAAGHGHPVMPAGLVYWTATP